MTTGHNRHDPNEPMDVHCVMTRRKAERTGKSYMYGFDRAGGKKYLLFFDESGESARLCSQPLSAVDWTHDLERDSNQVERNQAEVRRRLSDPMGFASGLPASFLTRRGGQ